MFIENFIGTDFEICPVWQFVLARQDHGLFRGRCDTTLPKFSYYILTLNFGVQIEPFEVIRTVIPNFTIQKTSLLSRFRKNDGGSQNFSNFRSSERSDPIGRKGSPLQRKPRLNGLQNNTSVQSTLRIAFINRL